MYRFRLFLLLGTLSFEGASAHAQSNQVYALAGGSTILPCILRPPPSADIPTVEWSKVVEGLQPAIVFLYRHGCETFAMKDPDFEYRTSLILRELQNGNLSLRMSNVKLSDSGMYQCRIIQSNGTKEETKVELVVGSLSEPKLSVVSADGEGVTVECEALCWMPAPQMTIQDDDGNTLTDEEPKQEPDPRGCYNTRQNVTLQNPVSRVVCRVNQQQRNQSKMADIRLPDFWKKSCVLLIILTLGGTASVFVTALSLYVWLNKKKSNTDGGNQAQTANASDQTMKSNSPQRFPLLDEQSEADNTRNGKIEEQNAKSGFSI